PRDGGARRLPRLLPPAVVVSKLTSEPAVEGPTSVPPLARRQLARGREMRGLVPRFSHAAWSAPASRPDVVTFIRTADSGRAAALLPLKYARMCASPFGFLRGAAALMAHDLSTTPSTGWRVQACGDAHLANFGAFATPERELVFDANDFDETTRGPWEWDLKRLGTSVVLVGRQNRLSAAVCTDAAL